jgi:predicted dehydrogenase
MKFLVVGLGSMGKRRIRNLQHLAAGEIIGCDPREDRRDEAAGKYGIKTLSSFEHGMNEHPDAVIISTPPDTHVGYALTAADAGLHFFTEVNVADARTPELIASCRTKNIVAAPSCTMRFHPSVRAIKELVDQQEIGKVLSLTYHFGQYLPDWHPWEDYRSFYVARRATGAAREMVCFELIWLTWILGPVRSVSCVKGKVSDLAIEGDDTYQLLLEFKDGPLGNMLVEVVSRVPIRSLRVMGGTGNITWDWSEKLVRVKTTKDERWRDILEASPRVIQPGYIHADDMYIDEMRHFLDAVNKGERYGYTLDDDWRIQECLLAAESSSEGGIRQTVV